MRVQMLYKILNNVVSPGPTPITRMEFPHYNLFIHYIVGLTHSNTPFSLKQSNHEPYSRSTVLTRIDY